MKKMSVIMVVVALTAVAIALVVNRPPTGGQSTSGNVNPGKQQQVNSAAAQPMRVTTESVPGSDAPMPKHVVAKPTLPERDWVPDSWPPAISRITEALNRWETAVVQQEEAGNRTNPVRSVHDIASAKQEFFAAHESFPWDESLDLYMPLKVGAFVSANTRNDPKSAIEAMALFGDVGVGMAQSGLATIADKYGPFAICVIDLSDSAPKAKAIFGGDRAIDFLAVTSSTTGDTGKLTAIKEDLKRSVPLSCVLVFASDLGNEEFAALDVGSELWLRVNCVPSPDGNLVSRIPAGQDWTRAMVTRPITRFQIDAIAWAEFNTKEQRASRARLTTAQAAAIVKETIRAKLKEEQELLAQQQELAAQQQRLEAQRAAELADRRRRELELSTARRTFFDNLKQRKRRFAEELVLAASVYENQELGKQIFAQAETSLVDQLANAYFTQRKATVTLASPTEDELKKVARTVFVVRSAMIDSPVSDLQDREVRQMILDLAREGIAAEPVLATVKASVTRHDGRATGRVKWSDLSGSKAQGNVFEIGVLLSQEGMSAGNPGKHEPLSYRWEQLPSFVFQPIDDHTAGVARTHGWKQGYLEDLQQFRSQFGVDP